MTVIDWFLASIKVFLEFLSKFKPVDIKIKKEQHTHNYNIQFGDNIIKSDKGIITLGDGNKILVQEDKDGNPVFIKDETEITTVKENKEDNIKLLDDDKKVFSRADISYIQLEFLSIEEKHEMVIKQLKPFLEDYRNNQDFASLLIASTIIRLEDSKQKNEQMITIYRHNLITSYKSIGRMVYNLFRSGILEKEIIPNTQRLQKAFPFDKARQNFLTEWHDIIQGGYPTAYFMQFWDDESKLFKEFNWRFDRKVSYVDVYSRGDIRNNLTQNLCSSYIQKNPNFDMQVDKPYELGLTMAIKIRIQPKK